MADENENEERSFKVIDRRREGRDEGGETPPQAPPEPETKAAAEPEPPPQSPDPEPQTHVAGDEEVFLQFLLSLATSASIHLGLTPHPESQQAEINLALAKQTIDILAMLERKTGGNLTDREAQIMQQVLSDLRMHFVEASKKEKPS